VGGALQLSGVFSLFFVSGPRNLIEATFKVAAKSWPKLDESQVWPLCKMLSTRAAICICVKNLLTLFSFQAANWCACVAAKGQRDGNG